MNKKFLTAGAMTLALMCSTASVFATQATTATNTTSNTSTSVNETIKKEDYLRSIVSENKENTKVKFTKHIVVNSENIEQEKWAVADETTGRMYLIFDNQPAEKYIIAKDGLNLRTFPNITYNNIFKAIPYREKVNIIGIVNNWAIVEYENNKYFCWADYLSDTQPAKIISQTVVKKTTTTTNKKNSSSSKSSNTSTTKSSSKNGQYSFTATLTAYCHCKKCCGKSNGITASGAKVKEGVTVANGKLPFGTRIYIEGVGERVVQDRGVGGNSVDIYFSSHSKALAFGRRKAKVTVLG